MIDTKRNTPGGAIESDLFLELVLNQYLKLTQQAQANLADLFVASDVRICLRNRAVGLEWLADIG